MMSATVALLQLPGVPAPELGWREQLVALWTGGGFMMWFLALAALVALGVVVWKAYDLATKRARTRQVLLHVDALLAEGRVAEALAAAEASDTPAGRILAQGLRRHDEGTERVAQAIENAGFAEAAKLERGLGVLATVSTIAPLLGFLGTVIGMIQAFQSIEVAGDVDASLVAGGIRVALITTAAGLAIAIPVSIAHSYLVSRVDRSVLDMEESAQRAIDALHEIRSGRRFSTTP